MKFPGFENEPFEIEEFVPPSIFNQFGIKSTWFIDIDVVRGMIYLRRYFNKPIIINTWKQGGKLQNRGFRLPSYPGGSKLSQHKFGKAVDFNVSGMTPAEVNKELIADQKLIMANTAFTTMEDVRFTPTWTHIDIRWTGKGELLVVEP